MEFGKLPSVDGVDLRLPADARANAGFLARLARRRPAGTTPSLLVGTATWGDRRLVGKLYPHGTRPSDFLRAYALAFRTNELNSTYYGVEPARIARWVDAVPPGFRFCPKFPASITHELGLDAAEAEIEAFLAALGGFGDRLGRAWVLLPPDFGPRRFPALASFVARTAGRAALAVELRHPDWFTDRGALEAVGALFEQHDVAAILCDVAGRRDVLHMRLTSRAAFVRFVGNGLHPSDFTRLDEWIERLGSWLDGGLETAYFFLHQPEDHETYELARYLLPRLSERTGLPLPSLDAARGPVQGELFRGLE